MDRPTTITRMTAAGMVTVAVIVAFASQTRAQETTGTKAKAVRIFDATTTANGQPIVLPQGNPEVVAWIYEIPVGARLPVHKHPFPRYAYVLQGSLQVVDAQSGRTFDYKAGDFIVEMRDAWHSGANTGTEPVRLLVIDQVDQGQANTILR